MKDLKVLTAMMAVFFFLLFGSLAHAYTNGSDELECAESTEGYGNTKNVSISCVSKASIELDKAQLKLVKMQIRKLEVEIKLMEETGQLPKTKQSK